MQQHDWQRRNALKRLSVDSAHFDAPLKRQSLDARPPLERDDSNNSAARCRFGVHLRIGHEE
jgi:hypothetical protein